MITPLLRSAGLIGAAVLGLTVGPALRAQVTIIDWSGAVDSNYLNAGNWVGGVVPGATTDIRLTNAATNRVINLNYTGTGNYTQPIYAIQNGVSLGYTINLSGTANGALTYSIVGRGTHPFTTPATGTSTGNASQRLSFYINAGPYTTINFVGSPLTPHPGGSTSGLTYAKVTLTNARITTDGFLGAATANTLQLGGLNMDVNSSVELGVFGTTISGSNAAGETELWAGRINQTATGTDPVTGVATGSASQKWGNGITRVTTTGVVNHPGVFNLRTSGSYLVDGVHNGPISSTASTNAVIGGTGTINGLVTANNGTSIAPAGRNATGTLTINGNVNLNGALSFELVSPTLFDRLVINGNLNTIPTTGAATGNLAVGVAESFPLQPGTFRVMNFTSMTGSFASVALPSSQGLAASYVLGSNYLDIIFTQLAYGTNPLLTGNYNVIANVLDRGVAAGTVPGSLLDNLNRQPSIVFFREVLDQLSPTCYYGWYPSAVVRSNAMTQTVNDRLTQRPDRNKGTWDAYTVVYRQESSIDANEWADYTNFDTQSVMGGVDTMISPSLIVGGLIEFASTNTDLNQQFSTSTTDSYTGGLYAQYRKGPFEAQAIGFLGADEYSSSRNVEKTKLGTWATSETEGMRMGASISASYTRKFSWIEVAPVVGFQVLNWTADAFTETGAAEASLKVKSQNETNLAGRLGVRFAQTYPTKIGTIRPFLNLGYQRSFGDETRQIKAVLFGESFAVTVPGIQKSGIRVDAGIDWSVYKTVSAQIRYSTETGGAADESLGLRAGLNVAF